MVTISLGQSQAAATASTVRTATYRCTRVEKIFKIFDKYKNIFIQCKNICNHKKIFCAAVQEVWQPGGVDGPGSAARAVQARADQESEHQEATGRARAEAPGAARQAETAAGNQSFSSLNATGKDSRLQ